MSDERIIKVFKGIKKNCRENTGEDKNCESCKFYMKPNSGEWHCQVMNLIDELMDRPNEWEIENIERIIKQ